MAHIDIALLAAECFANDGKLDANELDKIILLAEEDGELTQQEITALTNVIKRIRPEELDDAMQARLKSLNEKINALK